jgi:hypothetical protein
VKLTISAKDKFSWIIAPTVYLQPGNKGVGVGYGENNMFGENKKLLLYGQIATADSLFFAVYLDPSLGGSKISRVALCMGALADSSARKAMSARRRRSLILLPSSADEWSGRSASQGYRHR